MAARGRRASKKRGGGPRAKKSGSPPRQPGRGRSGTSREGQARGGQGPSGPGKPRVPSRRGGAPGRKTAPGTRVEAPSAGSGLWGRILEQARGAEQGEGLQRLNAYLARCGVASRRKCDELIEQGRVQVNGELVRELGVRVDPLRDVVAVDGETLQPEKPVYVVLHKPKGVVCTNARGEQKTRAIDLIPHVKGRVFPVGRLDLDSEGLLLLTNDGSFAERMTHPRYGVPKTYKVTLRGNIDETTLQKTRGGVWLAEGRTGSAGIKVTRRSKERTHLLVTIREGKNREIRRIFGRVGYPVLRLQRVRIGPLELEGLRKGMSRFLRPREVEELLAATAPEASPAQG